MSTLVEILNAPIETYIFLKKSHRLLKGYNIQLIKVTKLNETIANFKIQFSLILHIYID